MSAGKLVSPSLSSAPRKEAAVLAAVLAYLHTTRGMFERRNTGGAYHGTRFVKFNEPGTPDITGVLYPGIPFAVECKREGWRPTNERERKRFLQQLDWLERWCLSGGVGIVAQDVAHVVGWATHALMDRGHASASALRAINEWRLGARQRSGGGQFGGEDRKANLRRYGGASGRPEPHTAAAPQVPG